MDGVPRAVTLLQLVPSGHLEVISLITDFTGVMGAKAKLLIKRHKLLKKVYMY